MPKGLCKPRTAQCNRCASEYIKRAPAQRYCSDCGPIVLQEGNREKSRRHRAEKSTDPLWREKQSASTAKWVAANRGKAKAYQRAYAEANKNKKAIKAKLWREANPEKVKNQVEKFNKSAARLTYIKSDRRRELRRVADAKRYRRMDIRIADRISSSIRSALKDMKSGRSWENIVGYTILDLQTHLERQFLPGMSWNNIGEWHIDHIVPKSLFTFDSHDDQEIKACWSLANLRPLWGVDNCKKHAKRLYLI